MHTCKECNNSVFGGGYCKYHQYKRKMRGGNLYESKPRPKPSIPKESKTRKKERLRYTEVCQKLTEEIKAENGGKIYCYFSGIEITGKPTFHHLKGRTGDYYTDKEWLVPALNDYHLAYHFTPIEDLMKEDWYAGFLSRLKTKDYSLYCKEQKKIEKAQNYLDFS